MVAFGTVVRMNTRFVVVTGGVCSSLGKGILAASLARLLIDRGNRVRNIKLDPYLNIDPGTLRPSEHGEVFVTDDGVEADLDLGHYERFTDVDACRVSSATAGSIYHTVLTMERGGQMLGSTVQAVPHITDEIIRRLDMAASAPLADGQGADVVIVEIGGTVGDIEIQIFLEAVRQLRSDPSRNICVVHLVLVPEVGPNRELKTKPAQHSVSELRRHGVSPDVVVARSHTVLNASLLHKLQTACGVPCVVAAPDVASIYQVPANLLESGLDVVVAQQLGLAHVGVPNMLWRQAVTKNPGVAASGVVRVGLVGKYAKGSDTYLSVEEAVAHAAAFLNVSVELVLVDAATIDPLAPHLALSQFAAIIVPGGFGSRGVEGKVAAAAWCRMMDVPYLGLCLGLQVAVIDACRAAGVVDASSAEWVESADAACGVPVVVLMDEQGAVTGVGGTMRLGGMWADLVPGSKTALLYNSVLVKERHRHRFEVDPMFVPQMVESGLVVAGVDSARGLIEFVERPAHRFFHATQAHPEFLTRPDRPHPLFVGLLQAASTTDRTTGRASGKRYTTRYP